jgi:hypothetical protein
LVSRWQRTARRLIRYGWSGRPWNPQGSDRRGDARPGHGSRHVAHTGWDGRGDQLARCPELAGRQIRLAPRQVAEALEALLVEIDLKNEIVPVYMVRFGKNPPNYCRSYDGVDDLQPSKAMGTHGARGATPGCRLPSAVLGGRNPDDPHRASRTQA